MRYFWVTHPCFHLRQLSVAPEFFGELSRLRASFRLAKQSSLMPLASARHTHVQAAALFLSAKKGTFERPCSIKSCGDALGPSPISTKYDLKHREPLKGENGSCGA